jgi:hypothetical protein
LFVFYIGHPAHYYSSFSLAKRIEKRGAQILFVARAKDVVLDLVRNNPYETIIISDKERKDNKVSMILGVLRREIWFTYLALKRKPFMFIGTDIAITHIGKLFGIPAIMLNEDDEDVVPLLAKYGFKYSTAVLSPKSCVFKKYKHKKIEYEGFHKMLYLNKEELKHRFKKTNNLEGVQKPFFLIRLSGLKAHHDTGIVGIDNQLAVKIIKKLETHGHVYISSERELGEELQNYRLSIHPKDIHYYLKHAKLLISDSQSMSVEASMVGTPSIRYSSFSGRIGVLEELEDQYQLTFGIDIGNTKELFEKLDELLTANDSEGEFAARKKTLFQDKIDVLSFFEWFIFEYPLSLKTIRENPFHYKSFK